MLNKKCAAIGLAVAISVLSIPSVASAAMSPYADDPGARVQGAAIDTCQVSHVSFDAGYFTPGSRVETSVAGPAAAKASVIGDTAAPDGSLIVEFRPDLDHPGTYRLTFSGTAPSQASAPQARARVLLAPLPRTYTAVISVSDGHGCVQPPATVADPGPEHASVPTAMLAATGSEASPWLIGGGVGALVVGGLLVGAGITRRAKQN